MATRNYSKSEWASLSIQERIRAMNKVTGDDESLQQSVPSSEDVEQPQEEKEELPKRSSVVDIWRKREGPGGSSASKPKRKEPVRAPSPVSVPWPDEEDTPSPQQQQQQASPFQQQQSKPATKLQQQQPKAATPSWRNQLKSTSARSAVVEKKKEEEPDLTILPSTSSDCNEQAGTASHSKSVMDLYTKRTLTIPDSPMTVVDDEDSLSVATPKRSSVVDIWTKRTASDVGATSSTPNKPVSAKRSSYGSTAPATATSPPKEQASEKKKESPLKAWNRRKSTPKATTTAEEEDEKDLVVVEDEKEETPKESSVVNRYKQLAQLRNVSAAPPRPTVIETRPSQESVESLDKPKAPSSVMSAWGSQLRKVQRNLAPSPVTTEPTVDDDEHTDESAVEEQPKPSASIANRWKPQASGESPQLRKVPSPAVMPRSTEQVANRFESPPLRKVPQSADGGDDKRSSIANRWNPQGGTPQLRKVPKSVATEPSAEDAEGDKETAAAPPESADGGDKRSSIANRWNPQGGPPQLRKVPKSVATEPSAEDAEGDKETAAAPPEEPKRWSVANRWNPQGSAEASPQLRKTPIKLPPKIVTEPSGEEADGEIERVTEEPSRSSVTNRWNPQGSLASPQLRKVINKVATPIGAERSAAVTDVDKEDAAVEEPKRPVVANRWTRPQGPEASPQLRKAPVKVPYVAAGTETEPVEKTDESILKEPKRPSVANRWNPKGNEPSSSSEETTAPVQEKEPKRPSVANRWNPKGNEPSSSTQETMAPAQAPKKSSVLNRYYPQASGTQPQTQFRKVPAKESSPVVTQAAPDEDESVDRAEPAVAESKQMAAPTPSVLDRYKPKTVQSENASTASSLYKLPGSRNAPVVPQNPLPKETEEPEAKTSVSVSEPKRSSVMDRYKSPSKQPKVSNSWNLQKKETEELGAKLLKPSSNAPDALDKETLATEPPAKEPEIEPAVSLPFDESPTTKLFASIDMSKSTGSADLKADGDKVYDTTDADGFPALSTDDTKDEEDVPANDEEVDPPSDDDSEQKDSEGNKVSEETSLSGEKSEEPKLVTAQPVTAQRSKALELFATRRKYNHVVKVHTVDASSKPTSSKPPLMEAPVPKPATASKKAPVDTSSMNEGKRNRVDKDKFHSGTSAFTASPKASEVTSKESDVATKKSGATDKPAKRSKRPKSMKEFLKKHRMKASPGGLSSETTVTSTSVGSVESKERQKKNKRTDLSVNTCDESVATRDESVATHESAPVAFSAPTDGSAAPPAKQTESGQEAGSSKLDAPAGEPASVLSSAEKEDPEDEPGRIVSVTATKLPEKDKPISPPSLVASPSPRTRSLQERRRGRHKQGIGGSPATPRSLAKHPVSKKSPSPLRQEPSTGDNAPRIPGLKPVEERAKAFAKPSNVPVHGQSTRTLASEGKSTKSWAGDKKAQPPPAYASQRNVNSYSGTNPVLARWSQQGQGIQTQERPTYQNPATSDAGASDTLTFFSAASSGYSTAISGISVDGSVLSPTSSLSNRASRALVRRRRHKLSKEEEKMAAQDLAHRVSSHTIKEQPPSGADDEGPVGGKGNTVDESGSMEEPFFGHQAVPENDIPRGPGLSGRYNTSSRFMDSVQNLMKGAAPNMSFDSGTTEGSSQIRSVGSTSDSEAWMSERMRKSSASSLNRVLSDSTDGVSYQSESVMTNTTGRSKKGEEVVTEYFVSESASNLEALKSAYEAVSLHQIAMDLTDEVSVATNVDLKKIASNLNEGMSAASSSLRSGLNNLNSGSSSASKKSIKLKVPTPSSKEARDVDEEVAIEVEYMEDSDEEDGQVDPPPKKSRDLERKPSKSKKEEHSMLPAGEPSQEKRSSSDQRRAYM